MRAEPARCSGIHLNDLAGQIPPYDPAASEEGGSLWATLPDRQGWGRLNVKG